MLRAPLWPDAGDCTIDGGADVGLIEGVLDISQGTPYLLPLAVFNNLQSQNTSSSNAGIITNEIQLRDASVELDSEDAPALMDPLTDANKDFDVTLASDSVAPGEAVGVAVEVIGRDASSKLRDQLRTLGDIQPHVNATVVVHGLRSGNTAGKIGIIDAREFTFPIRICDGCLLTCAGCEEVVDEVTGEILRPKGACPDPAFEPGTFVGGICGNAQDFFYGPPECELPS